MGTRLNVQFSAHQQRLLEDMARELHTTPAGVLQKALSLLQATIRERQQHNSIAVVKDGEVVKEIVGISQVGQP